MKNKYFIIGLGAVLTARIALYLVKKGSSALMVGNPELSGQPRV